MIVMYYVKKRKCPQCSREMFPLIVDILFAYAHADIFLIFQTNSHGISGYNCS